MLNDRLRRVTDLFIEGTELFFGFEKDGTTPILIWSNKLNSFESQEAQNDGQAARGLRLAELSKDDSPDVLALKATMSGWDDDKLAEQRVEQMVEDIYLQVINDLETSPEWREKLELVRRGTAILDDSGAEDTDQRRETILQAQNEYIEALRKGQSEEQLRRLADIKGNARDTNEADFLEEWRKRTSIEDFMRERRATEIFLSLRDCKGTVAGTSDNGELQFDHTDCDHNQKLLAERKEVFALPEELLKRAGDALDGITVPARAAGNSDAPASSSASSEQPSAEADSTPSTPEGMQPVVHTT